MNIKNKIKQIREIHKLNQSEFAERLGVTQKIISNLESGKNEPSLQLIKNLTITFNISIIWLMNENEENFDEMLNKVDNIYLKSRQIIKNKYGYDEVINFLKEFNKIDDILENDISNKFRTIKGKDFISKLGEFWSAKGERMLIILYEFLLHLKEKKLIMGPNIKNEFIEILKSFTPTYRPFIINKEDKDRLIKWCEENLEDIEIIDIMTSSSTIEKVISSVKNELNIFNKYTI